MDLDFVTRTLASHNEVRKTIETVCVRCSEDSVFFSLKNFVPLENGAASIIIAYDTQEGQSNTFTLDVVYSVPTLVKEISSPVTGSHEIVAATLENIVVDKISVLRCFGGGNTRMKDFDDLWRISKVVPNSLDWNGLRALLRERVLEGALNPGWVNPQMERIWLAHRRRNPGILDNLFDVIKEINDWLNKVLSDNWVGFEFGSLRFAFCG